MTLRPYQQRAIDELYKWLEANPTGHPCIVLPTGSGKSHVIAALCKDAVQSWPETRILMLTHVKELIAQNAEKMRQHWPGAPMGIYSASLKRRDLGEPITFAGIQSVRTKAALIGHIDLVIIDESHLCGHTDEGGYRRLLADLTDINPALRVVGLTATPWRLGHGLITDKPAIFDAPLIEPVDIEELISKGHLATLRSKATGTTYDMTGIHKRGGDYIESEVQQAVNTDDQNAAVVDEIIARAEGRKAWLIFCTGVDHAEAVADCLRARGITTGCVLGTTPAAERDQLLTDFKTGRITAMTNANVLTTGFDHPGIDLIAMLRPTLSPVLYVQMAGRGMRPAPDKDDCLVLDFAGVVATHGPITAVRPPDKAGKGDGEAPVKVCESCHELCAISARVCPACGEPFPVAEPVKLALRDDDIMGGAVREMQVSGWLWRKHISRASGKEMLAVTYYGDLSDAAVTEYLPILHDGYAGQKAMQSMLTIASRAGASLADHAADPGLDRLAETLNGGAPPATIKYKVDGKFFRVLERSWPY
jgi:DNA repair protein RadD